MWVIIKEIKRGKGKGEIGVGKVKLVWERGERRGMGGGEGAEIKEGDAGGM